MFFRRSLLMSFCLLALSVSLILAQQNQCEELVGNIWKTIDDNCADLGGNEACYGYNRLNVDFVNPDTLPKDYFSQEGDFASLADLANISPVVFDPTIPEWGVSVLNVQANIPDSLPGQYVKMFLMGNVDMENGVQPADAFVSDRSVAVETASNLNMRYFPRTDSKLIQAVPENSKLMADALNEDGTWIRVVYNGKPGWIVRSGLTEESSSALLNLPMISEDTQSSMQAFYFNTGIGNPTCKEAPSTLLVQGPKDFAVDITANGARIRIGSTILLQTSSSDKFLNLVVLAGEVDLYPDTDYEVKIPAGRLLARCLSEARNLGIDKKTDDRTVVDCEPPRLLTPQEIADLKWVEDLPSGLLNYPIPYPPGLESTAEETPVAEAPGVNVAPPSNLPTNCVPRSDWTNTYTVQVGDTLTGIATQFGLTYTQLANGNCIENPDLLLPGEGIHVPQLPPPVPTLTPTSPPAPPPPPPPAMVDLAVSVAQISPLPGPYPFEPSTYRIKVTNNGAINATAVNVTHTIPASLTGVSSNTSQGTYNGSTWNIGSLASGASATLTVTGAPNLPSPSTFSPSAQASSSETDSNPGNNTGSTTIPVRIIVNTLSDSGTGGCNTTECTLREAIALAALTTGMDTITFSSSGTISLNGTQLLVDSDIDLRASGITIDAANLSRIMQVNNPGGIVKVNGITMTRGNCNSAGCWSGGILNSSSTMTITNSTFTNSTAEWGAAVFNADIMTIDSSNFANNVSWSAGAVTNSGTLTVSNSNFTSNVALALGNGGGIDNWATATVNTSTFNSNVPDHCVGITMTGTGNTLINPAIDPDCP